MADFNTFKADVTYLGKTEKPAVSSSVNNTDVVAPEFKLYIEGVQVPFESISISQIYTGLPSAEIQIPPQSGLLDIIRGYEPKVHIFFRDDNYGGDRLLFWGVIVANSYSRSRRESNTYITFRCEHKNSVIENLTLDFAGWASPVNQEATDNNPNSAAKISQFNSTLMIISALEGIDGVSIPSQEIKQDNDLIEDAPVTKLDPSLAKLEDRFKGMPGVAVNIWNQIKKDAYINKYTSLALTKMYIPLIDEGISYFKRMSGHPFIEEKLQTDKITYCNTKSFRESKILIPPYYKNSIASAVQGEYTVDAIYSQLGFSGELTSFPELLRRLYFGSCEYDMLTLASPAEVCVDPNVFVDNVNEVGVEKCTIETIIKPKMPFYFSPTCNVLLPRMYSGLMLSQNENVVPTRISAVHDILKAQTGPNSFTTSYKGPHSFREAVAYNYFLKSFTISGNPGAGVANNPNLEFTQNLDLQSTLGLSYFIPSKYEQGKGIHHQKIALPWWLAVLCNDKSAQGSAKNQEIRPEKGSPAYIDLIINSAEWKSRYGRKTTENDGQITSVYSINKNLLNPYDPSNSTVLPHERIMYSSVDYEYSQKVANSRNGTVECVFNPYIIPGYPMDIIDDSPNHPSFHAFCTSVTHTISTRSVSTTVSMVNVVSYAELSNYYMPPLPAFLNVSLEMVNGEVNMSEIDANPFGSTAPVKSTASVLIQNPVAKKAADSFYRQVLGVGAVAPDDLIHFASNRAYPLERKAGILLPKITPGTTEPSANTHFHQAREGDDFYSVVGNLRLVSRPIESKASIETKFRYSFINLDPYLYNTTQISYLNPKLASSLFMEPGASLFLDYLEVEDFIKI